VGNRRCTNPSSGRSIKKARGNTKEVRQSGHGTASFEVESVTLEEKTEGLKASCLWELNRQLPARPRTAAARENQHQQIKEKRRFPKGEVAS